MLLNLLNNTKKNHLIAISLIAFFPLLVFFGSGIINLSIIFIDLIFLYELYRVKRLDYLKNKFFYLLLFLWLIFLINLFFSIDVNNSLSRSLGFCRFIIFVFALKFYIFDENKNYKNYIFLTWSIIFSIICFDLLYEFIFGKNILGFESYMPGRLSGFFDQELKIGYLFSAIPLIILSFINSDFSKIIIPKKYLIYALAFVIFFISILIGERSNFIKTFIMIVCFLFLFEKGFYFRKILIISSIFLLFASFLAITPTGNYYKYRYWDRFLKPVINSPIDYINKTHYGNHYKAAYEVFKNHKLFGVGLRNYRVEVSSGKYGTNTSIHPHEKHLEVLSETGLFGYFFFLSILLYSILIGIKLFLKNKNLYQLSGLLFIIANLIPLIPSGSFFTTYTATFFWFSYAFMINTNKEDF